MTQPSYPGAPSDAAGETPSLLRFAIRALASVINRINTGKINCTGTVTLTANAASTTVTDSRATAFSFIGLLPTTANAAAEYGAGTWRVATRQNGSFVITHANNAQTDRDFIYVILG